MRTDVCSFLGVIIYVHYYFIVSLLCNFCKKFLFFNGKVIADFFEISAHILKLFSLAGRLYYFRCGFPLKDCGNDKKME
ncbi:MAG: hypothetical protein DRP78_00810 [Candidatus Omnitrophota bacterium]|nr:MAG: hypothetical protein DRP78_00810 [Candidatus Omnitrophota bacterium]